MARLTEGWGRRVCEERTAEAACANQPGRRGERLAQRRLPEVAAITTQANISTDGAMLLVREEGWKEVKVVAISEVQTQPGSARSAAQPSRRDDRPPGHLDPAQLPGGLWDADTMAEHQYAEGLRQAAWTIAPNAVRSTTAPCGSSVSPLPTSRAYPKSWIGRTRPGISGPSLTPCTANAPQRPSSGRNRSWTSSGTGKSRKWSPRWISSTCSSPAGRTWCQEAPNYFRSNQERMRYDQFPRPKLPDRQRHGRKRR